MYDCVTYGKNPVATFRGHDNATFYVKSCVSPDDQYLLSGSGDCDGYIWRIGDPTAAPFHLTGHTNEVTSVAWCPTDQTKVGYRYIYQYGIKLKGEGGGGLTGISPRILIDN